jgi:hypothetical protein
VILSLVMAACNVVFFFLLLEALAARHLCQLGRGDRLWLLALFAFGTVHLACSKLGGVWLNSQIAAVTMTILFVLSIIARWHPALSGMFLILGTLARTPVFFFFPLLAIRLLERDEHSEPIAADPAKLKRALIQFAAPIIIGAGLMGLMNLARFGNPFQFGYDHLGNELAARYGFFSFHHLPDNLRLALLEPPVFSSVFPFIGFSTRGMSILFTTPAWFGLLRLRRDTPYKWLWWLSIALVALTTLVWASTGGQQFGYRYSLDYTPLLLLLLAMGKARLGSVLKGLMILSIIINVAGAIWLNPW